MTITTEDIKKLYSLVEGDKAEDLQNNLNDIEQKDFFELLKWHNNEDGDNTILHVAFGEANKDVIDALAKKAEALLSNEQLKEVLNVQNDGGQNPLVKIIQREEGQQIEIFKAIVNGFSKVDSKNAVLLSYGNNKETFLHTLIEESNSNLLNESLEIAKENNFLKDVLTALDGQGYTALHVAALEGKTDFLTQALNKASDANISEEILLAKDLSENTVVHHGLISDKIEVNKLILQHATQELLKAENRVGSTPTNELLKKSDFINVFKALDEGEKNKAIDAILNLYSEENLKDADEDEYDSSKLTELYEEVKTDENLKAKFLQIVKLDATEYNVIDFFKNIIITAKLQEVEEAQKDVVKGLEGEDITYDSLNAANEKIKEYEDKFIPEQLPKDFGSSVITAIKEKLKTVSSEVLDTIQDAGDKDALKVAYEAANVKVQTFNFTNFLNSTNSAVQTKVKEKAETFGGAVCKKSKEEYKTVKEAEDCENTIKFFNSEFSFLATEFAQEKNVVADYIKDSSLSKDDAEKGLSSAFYYAKDLVMSSGGHSDPLNPNYDAANRQQKLVSLGSDIGDRVPGMHDRDKFYGMNINTVYKDIQGLALKTNTGKIKNKNVKKFVKIVNGDVQKKSTLENAETYKSIACDALKVDGECERGNILTAISNKVCKVHEESLKDTNAFNTFCGEKAVKSLDNLSYDSIDFLLPPLQGETSGTTQDSDGGDIS